MALVQQQTYRPMEQDREPRDKIHVPMDTLYLTKEAKIYNGEKAVSVISDSGETWQLCIK